jgi:glucuronate isomerase
MVNHASTGLRPDRYFDPEPNVKAVAQALYRQVSEAPLICPHGHVDPRMFADPDYSFGTPTELLLIPDHYVFRMLYSQGIPLENLGIPRRDGGPIEKDHRKVWQVFADHFYLFRGTPTGVWLADELRNVFGIEEKLSGQNAQSIYDQIEAKLNLPEFRPRDLFKRFNIEVSLQSEVRAIDRARQEIEVKNLARESIERGKKLAMILVKNG